MLNFRNRCNYKKFKRWCDESAAADHITSLFDYVSDNSELDEDCEVRSVTQSIDLDLTKQSTKRLCDLIKKDCLNLSNKISSKSSEISCDDPKIIDYDECDLDNDEVFEDVNDDEYNIMGNDELDGDHVFSQTFFNKIAELGDDINKLDDFILSKLQSKKLKEIRKYLAVFNKMKQFEKCLSGQFESPNWVSVRICSIQTLYNVLWQDGTKDFNITCDQINSSKVFFDRDLFPGYVVQLKIQNRK